MIQKIAKKILSKHIYLPIPGIGCGVLGLALLRSSKSIGEYASILLKALEYRGYDSTGAAFLDDKKNITLLKDIGAPSTLVKTLGIEKQSGKLFCGQVRWATFGSVDKLNSQPHVVNCKQHIFGAHNGNITNTRELRKFLQAEGHEVISDNDGEIVVHMVEHYLADELFSYSPKQQETSQVRQECMKRAIPRACARLTGSFAAVITDPITEIMYTIKAGSSLYFGMGEIEGESFALASSDLTAVLRFTKNIVNLKEGEFVEFDATSYRVYAYRDIHIKNEKKQTIKTGEEIKRPVVRSQLRAEDTQLLPQFNYFMEQEIFSEVDTAGRLVKLCLGGSNSRQFMLDFLNKCGFYDQINILWQQIFSSNDHSFQKNEFCKFITSATATDFYEKIKVEYAEIYEEVVRKDFENKYLFSSDKNIIIDLLSREFDKKELLLAKALDSISEQNDVDNFERSVKSFIKIIEIAARERRNVYIIACGSSFNAAKIGAQFFNEIANIEIQPILPGDFRSQYSNSLRNNDVIIGVSQSGETKDLIDIFNDIDMLELNIKKIVIVNNLNSTLGQEKSDVSIPILCGPEIAVPATKSFINQIVVFYYMAIRSLELMVNICKENPLNDSSKMERELRRRIRSFTDIPQVILETIECTRNSIKKIAENIYLAPSMQILATKITGVAKEGALKIRETVLNHTEGGEASEFKHGPNTILGKNTTLGFDSMSLMMKQYNKIINKMEELADQQNINEKDIREIRKAIGSYIFERITPFNLTKKGTDVFNQIIEENDFFDTMFVNYPLIYVTGPEERDINLTISQINTHKIRGANTFIIAEDNESLAENATYICKDGKYISDYIKLPKTGDSLMVAFSATVAIQLLSLEMSVKKMNYLNRLGVSGHGVHPDIPKNVSKSITVD